MADQSHAFTTPALALLNFGLFLFGHLVSFDAVLSVIAHAMTICVGVFSICTYWILNRKKLIARWQEWRSEK